MSIDIKPCRHPGCLEMHQEKDGFCLKHLQVPPVAASPEAPKAAPPPPSSPVVRPLGRVLEDDGG